VPRIHCPSPLAVGQPIALPAAAARHVQVLRMQPGDPLTLFNGEGGEWQATIERMGRSDVQVHVDAHHATEREAPRAIHLAVGIPANERMDWLVEKATELGAASIQPLTTARSVLRLAGERAAKKRAHWQAIAVAACEQCGRNRVPPVHEPLEFADWIASSAGRTDGPARIVLSLSASASESAALRDRAGALLVLSGPEGGLEPREEELARAADFVAVTLGARVLRAETAPIALLAALTLLG
jgi:16S rRNA (uracil1498-N3)-methyltransferase